MASLYAPIGKAAVFTAVGLKKNYKKETFAPSEECYQCAHLPECMAYLEAKKQNRTGGYYLNCQNCSKLTSVYVNEKNRYGSRAKLNHSSILLFLYLHLQRPTKTGVVKSFFVKEASIVLALDQKTVRAALSELREKGYIEFYHGAERGSYIVAISGYEDYFKPASEGGRGFFYMDEQVFKQMCSLKGINALRIFLRSYVEIDSVAEEGRALSLSRKMDEVRMCLPSYLRPSDVKDLLFAKQELFQVSVVDKVKFTLKESFSSKLNRKSDMERNRMMLTSMVDDFNHYVELQQQTSFAEIRKQVPEWMQPVFYSMIRRKKVEQIRLSDRDTTDLLQMSMQYGFDAVQSALLTLMKGKWPNTFAPAVRALIEENNQEMEAA